MNSFIAHSVVLKSIVTSIVYLFVSCIMLFISKLLFDAVAVFKIDPQVQNKNHTATIAFCGYLLGIVTVMAGAFSGPSDSSFGKDLLMYVLYSLLGIILMNVSGVVASKVLLNKFDNAKELLHDANIGTAAVYFGLYLTSGLIVSACVNGEYGGIVSSIVYYALGMSFLFLFLKIYDKITPYSIHDELENDNYSVGIALAGNIIAVGLILMKATLGESSDLKTEIVNYFTDLIAIVLLLPSVRFILGNVILKKTVDLNKEIKENNVAAGLIEFVSIICFAVLVFFMVDFKFF